jgi:hypothetical protein
MVENPRTKHVNGIHHNKNRRGKVSFHGKKSVIAFSAFLKRVCIIVPGWTILIILDDAVWQTENHDASVIRGHLIAAPASNGCCYAQRLSNQ